MRVLLLLLVLLCLSVEASDAGVKPDASAVYKRRCQSCHGDSGNARTPVGEREGIPDFQDPAWQSSRTDAAIREVVAHGSPGSRKMPAFSSKLTEAELQAMVAYIRSFAPTPGPTKAPKSR